MAHRVAVDLTPQALDQIAARVTQLLEQQRAPELLTTGELALYLRVQRPWVYKNRHLLGGQRIGEGPKAPWRFERKTAEEALRQVRAVEGMGAQA